MAVRNKSQIPGVPLVLQQQRTDLDILSRIKRREPAALGELYDRCGKRAYSIILRIVPDEDTAEDLLAETFVMIWNQIGRWKDARMEDLRLWVLLLARNHALEYLRSRNDALPKALPRPGALTNPNVLLDFPRPRDPDHLARLRIALSSLNEKESRILEMAAFDGLPASEIAVNLGESVMSVKNAINAALQKLASADS